MIALAKLHRTMLPSVEGMEAKLGERSWLNDIWSIDIRPNAVGPHYRVQVPILCSPHPFVLIIQTNKLECY